MKVFLSWSGGKSRAVAELLRDWLPDVVNSAEPWMSSEDIEKGTVGLAEISDQLRDTSFGIVCLTKENQSRPWINYEAGAMSKSLSDNARVATLLVDLARPGDVTGPLSQFQSTHLTKPDVKRLMHALDQACGTTRSFERVGRVVDRLWPDFEKELAGALAANTSASETHDVRADRDVLDEILTLTRDLQRGSSLVSARQDQLVWHGAPPAPKLSSGQVGDALVMVRAAAENLAGRAVSIEKIDVSFVPEVRAIVESEASPEELDRWSASLSRTFGRQVRLVHELVPND